MSLNISFLEILYVWLNTGIWKIFITFYCRLLEVVISKYLNQAIWKSIGRQNIMEIPVLSIKMVLLMSTFVILQFQGATLKVMVLEETEVRIGVGESVFGVSHVRLLNSSWEINAWETYSHTEKSNQQINIVERLWIETRRKHSSNGDINCKNYLQKH